MNESVINRRVLFVSAALIAIPALYSIDVFFTNFIGSQPHRESVDIGAYPWSSIGKIGSAGYSSGQHCTGAVVGPNQFLTAAHCLYNAREARFMHPSSIHLLLGYSKGEYRVHRVASRYTIPPTYVPRKLDAASADWAIVYIEEPLPAEIRPLRLAATAPLAGTQVKLGGYPIERPHTMTADYHCQIKAVSPDGKLITHDCVTHHGDSGGPLLSADDEGSIMGVNVLGYSLRVELEEQSKEGGMAVSAASISDFLASQVVSSIDGESVRALSTRRDLPLASRRMSAFGP